MECLLLPYVGSVTKSLSSISVFWSDILTTALTVLMSGFDTILNSPAGPILLNTLRPTIIKNWVVVREAVDQYIQVVT
jgi:hypothetical protein